MSAKPWARFLARCALVLVVGATGWAYTLIQDGGGYVVTWAPGSIPMQLKLATSPALSDGTSQSASVLAAMNAWNTQLGVVQFSAQTVAPGAYEIGNEVNEVVMDSTIGGEAFDSNTLAVTMSWRVGHRRVESDIIFNTAWQWDSFRGDLQAAIDIRRVALHELGHVLGLNHPDQAGQSVTAVMNSTVSGVDALQSDDQAGGQALYGAPGVVPANNSFSNALAINLASGPLQVTGTNVAATAEPGEPAHAGETARRSVWWKWTAPAGGTLTVTTLGSNFDTVLGIYTGASVPSLAVVAANDEANGGTRTSAVTFNPVNGTTYYFAVDGWNGFFGAIALNLNYAPENPQTAPTVTRHPSSATVLVGAVAQFSVAATGNPTPAFQWQRSAGGGGWVNLSDGVTYSGVTTSTLIVGAATAAMNQDAFRCVVSNSAGNATSGVGILTVQPLEAPTIVGIPSYASAPGQNVTLSGTITGTGLSYQWYRNGVAVPGATSQYFPITNALPADFADYFLVASNSLGTAVSRTIQLSWYEEWTQSRHWIKSESVDGVVYFLYADTPRIERYDLATETWLSNWTLAGEPRDFIFTASHLYVAVGNNVIRYGRDFGGATTFVSRAHPIRSLIMAGNYLVTTSEDSSITTYASYQASSGAPVGSFGQVSGFMSGLSYDPSTGAIFGGALGKLTLQANGSFSDYVSVSSSGSFAPVPRTYAAGFPGTVIGNGGAANATTNLAFVGSFGVAFGDIMSDGAGGYFVLRGIDLIAFDSRFRTTGSVRLNAAYAKLAKHQANFFTFGQPGVAGARPIVQKIPAGQVLPPARPAALNPVGRQIRPTSIVVGKDGTLYVHSKFDGNIYRWSPVTQSYLSSIPVSGQSDHLAIDESERLYFVGPGAQVRTVGPDNLEQPFFTGNDTVWGLQTAGQHVVVVDHERSDYAKRLVSPTGSLLAKQSTYRTAQLAWTPATRRFYQFRDNVSPNDLMYTDISPAGLFGLSGDSPYNGSVVTKYPIRVSPDGSRVALGSGQVFAGTTLSHVSSLGITPLDLAWSGNRLHTIRADGANTRVESWSQETYQFEREAIFSGAPVRLLALPGNCLVLVTLNAGIPTYRLLQPTDLTVAPDYVAPSAPVITGQPSHRSVVVGQAVQFTVTATVSPAPTYQWQRLPAAGGGWGNFANGGNYSGVTTATLTVSNAALAMAGDQFRCVVTNNLGTATSNAALLAVRTPVKVTTDFSGDGKSDLLLTNAVTGLRYVWHMNGTAYVGEAHLGTLPVHWRISGDGDFDRDGESDLLLTNEITGARYIWLMDDSVYREAVYVTTAGAEWEIGGTGDFNSDGLVDILVSNTTTGDRYVWLMRGMIYDSTVALGREGAAWRIAGAGDFNNDGKPDVLWQNSSNNVGRVWLMNGTTNTSEVTLPFGGLNWQMTGSGDYNNDGYADIVWQNVGTGARRIWLMNGTSLGTSVALDSLGLDWTFGAAVMSAPRGLDGDFNSDGKPDLVLQNRTTGDRYVWLMNGTAYSDAAYLGNIGPDWDLAGKGDFNNDSKPDLVWQNTVTGDRYVWLMNGTTYMGEAYLGNVPPTWDIAGTGDFNGDGKADLILQNLTTGDRYVWLMNGTTYMGEAYLGRIGSDWRIAGSADFNQDGKPDLIWQNRVTGDRYIWTMNGTTYTGEAYLGTVGTNWDLAGAADYNGDGKPDLVLQNTVTGDRYIWMMNGTTYTGEAYLGFVGPAWRIVR